MVRLSVLPADPGGPAGFPACSFRGLPRARAPDPCPGPGGHSLAASRVGVGGAALTVSASCSSRRGYLSLPDLLSWGSSQRCPSVEILRVRPLPVHYRPRPAGCPADWTCALSGSRPWERFGFVANARPRNANPVLVPPLPFLTTSAVYSAHEAQVCCTLLPTMGFAWLQAPPGGGRTGLSAGPKSNIEHRPIPPPESPPSLEVREVDSSPPRR